MDTKYILDRMMASNLDLYEKIMDTVGFAYWFNQLCLKSEAQDADNKRLRETVDYLTGRDKC